MASLSSLSFRTCAFNPGEGFDFAKKIVTVGINHFRTSNVMTHEDKQNVTTKICDTWPHIYYSTTSGLVYSGFGYDVFSLNIY